MRKKRMCTIGLYLIVIIGLMVTRHYYALAAALQPEDELKVIFEKGTDTVSYKNNNEIIKVKDQIMYISVDELFKNMNIIGAYDEENKMAVFTGKEKVIRFYGDQKVKINQQEVDHVHKMMFVGGKAFVPIHQIKDYINIECNFIQDMNIIVLKNQVGEKLIAKVSKNNVKIKEEVSVFAEIVDVLQEGDEINILRQEGDWLKVLTKRGKTGYVETKYTKDKKNIEAFAASGPIWKPENGKINLTWEHVYRKNPDTSKIGELKGVNVISPTWISLTNASGEIKHRIGKDYIEWAKKRDCKIWALFTNSFDPKMTNEFLRDAGAREKAINHVLKLVKENNMDGINIDFENIYMKDKDQLVLFIRELVPVFHEYGLVVSMDVTVKSRTENWSLCYDREALGKTVDYLALMAYDEHWGTSPKSGSVASMGWVEKGIKQLISVVPEEKIILGVPFYTRVWKETPLEDEPNKVEVKSKAITMEKQNEILKRDDIIKVWDEKSGQYYVEYIEDEITHKIWVEDAESMKLRANMIPKYNLAGIASWRRGYETENIWNIIDETIKKKEK